MSTMKDTCCQAAGPDNVGDCSTPNWPKGAAVNMVTRYAADEEEWLEDFIVFWNRAT